MEVKWQLPRIHILHFGISVTRRKDWFRIMNRRFENYVFCFREAGRSCAYINEMINCILMKNDGRPSQTLSFSCDEHGEPN